QRCTSDVNTVKMFVAGQQLMGVLSSTFLLILIVGMMFTMNVKLTLMSVAVLPITFLFAIRFFKIIQKTFREFDESEARMTTRLQEVLTGVRVVKAFGRQKEEIERFEEK
ncbi:ABC transporter ATP-binding protein, partial [Bacillus licheniformis]|uniref:ABC transporter transmembrane domain-containing protein n=1 Tax=Bacillus licheniformis TaxID=1402 RepID=UPI000F9A4BFC